MSSTAMAADLFAPSNPTIADLRRNRFQDLGPDMQGVVGYLEQLASQTGTNIDTWTLAAFQGIAPHDRRAINRVFFAGKEASTVGIDKISVEVEAALTETKLKVEETQKARIADLENTRLANLKAANESHNQILRYLNAGWNAQKEIYAIQDKGATYVTDDLKRLLTEGFWEFHKYENSIVQLATKNDVIMSESNASAGIERRVNMGKYLAHYYVKTAALQVHRYKQNCVAQGHYHPYVNSNGQICWGNAGNTANDMLVKGKLYEVFGLLASLLVTYSPTATPYARLLEFHALKTRADAGEAFDEESPPECEWCGDDPDDCNCCHQCQSTRDDCHCCAICDGDMEDCGCCQECSRRSTDCEACVVCSSHEECECCRECERTANRMERDGHAEWCDHRAEEEEEEEEEASPTQAEPAAPAQEPDLEF